MYVIKQVVERLKKTGRFYFCGRLFYCVSYPWNWSSLSSLLCSRLRFALSPLQHPQSEAFPRLITCRTEAMSPILETNTTADYHSVQLKKRVHLVQAALKLINLMIMPQITWILKLLKRMGVSWSVPRKNSVSLAVFSLLLFLCLSHSIYFLSSGNSPQICYTNVTLSCCPTYFSLKKKYIFSCFKQMWWSLRQLIPCHLLTKISSNFQDFYIPS